jgi:hypothetical protein
MLVGAPVHLMLGTGTATPATLVALGLFFLKAGAFIFGSGLAIVPFLREGVVLQHQWLTEGQFLDAVAMGLITPGPVVITAAFIGYLVGGFAGAAIATVAIFIPIYLGVVIPGPWFIRHQDNASVRAFREGSDGGRGGGDRRSHHRARAWRGRRRPNARDPVRQPDLRLALQEQGADPRGPCSCRRHIAQGVLRPLGVVRADLRGNP